MASALGGFVTGLQGGLETAQRARRNRELDKLIQREGHMQDLELGARKEVSLAEWMKAGGTEEEWQTEQAGQFGFEESPDPFLFRAVDWLRGLGKGRGTGTAPVSAPSTQPPRTAIPTPGSPALTYADGGKVSRRRGPHRARAIPTDEEEYVGGGGVREFGKDLARSARDFGGRAMYAPRAIGREASDVAGDIAMRGRDVAGAETARERGGAVRDLIGETVVGAGRVGGRTIESILLEPLAPIGEGILGFLGQRGEDKSRRSREAAAPAPDEGVTQPTAIPVDPDAPEAAVTRDTTAPPSAEAVAANAVQHAGKVVPGHPDNDGQQYDWAEVRDAGVTPDDIPSVPAADWAEYRKRIVQAAAMRGQNTTDAHAEVDQMQMRGFTTNLQQAAYLARAGDLPAAALAARAAYQYFPNGSDVRFGIMNGPTGPVLVGIGRDEETGEPVMDGKPMVMTAELMEAMAENMSKPGALRAWTKDWHEAEAAERRYQEVGKPTAQAELDLTAAKTEQAYATADKYRADAAATRQKPAGRELSQSDYDRAYEKFMASQELTRLDDRRTADDLATIMSVLYQQDPSIPFTGILGAVMNAYDDGTLQDALNAADVNETFALLGLR